MALGASKLGRPVICVEQGFPGIDVSVLKVVTLIFFRTTVYCKVTTTSKVVSAFFEKCRNNKAETSVEDVGLCRNSKDP